MTLSSRKLSQQSSWIWDLKQRENTWVCGSSSSRLTHQVYLERPLSLCLYSRWSFRVSFCLLFSLPGFLWETLWESCILRTVRIVSTENYKYSSGIPRQSHSECDHVLGVVQDKTFCDVNILLKPLMSGTCWQTCHVSSSWRISQDW